MSDEKLNTKWISPEIICSYPNLSEPNDEKFGGKYAISIPLPKSDKAEYEKLMECMDNAAVNFWGPKAKGLKGIKTFIEDCDEDPKYENDRIYSGCYRFSAKAKLQPGMVYQNLTPVEKEQIDDTFYPGAIIRVSISAYATETGGSKTVAFGLNNIMFVRHGERLGGTSNPENDFAAFKSDDQDELFA